MKRFRSVSRAVHGRGALLACAWLALATGVHAQEAVQAAIPLRFLRRMAIHTW